MADILVVKRFPAELHRRLRLASADSGQDMREIVIRAVTVELAKRPVTVPGRSDDD